MISRGTLRVLVGPVGAGKTTFAEKSATRSPALFLDLDSWMVRLFGADPRPEQDVLAWYLERRERCRAVLWDVALSAINLGSDVWLEIGLLAATERQAFFDTVRGLELAFQVVVVDAPRDVRRQRVLQRNAAPRPDTQIVPPEFFERASDAWEPLSESERTSLDVIDV